MQIKKIAPAAIAIFVLSGCGIFQESDEERAKSLAMESCGIMKASDKDAQELGISEGEWFAPPKSSDTWDPSSVGLVELKEILDGVEDGSNSANAAAQLDAKWSGLAESSSKMYLFASKVYDTRRSGQPFYEWTYEESAKHWDEKRAICGGLTTSLNN
jgi:hypothetical protein